ncbi:MAG: fatty acid cis/trans isomerase, partial [Halothiobacillus sp.]|nr:fatty acid cis/trans isomerase [Halothiobacillus sp.]
IGSYPNLFFDLTLEQAPEFFDVLMHYDDSPAYRKKLMDLIVTREEEGFWQTYDWFQERFNATHPIQAGLFDLNRYYYRAFSPEDINTEDVEF